MPSIGLCPKPEEIFVPGGVGDKCLENSGHLRTDQSIGRKVPWLSRPGERLCGIPRLNATRPRQHPAHRFTATVRNPSVHMFQLGQAHRQQNHSLDAIALQMISTFASILTGS